MNSIDRRQLVTLALAVMGAFSLGAAAQSAYPAQTLKIIVPFTPGTGMDTIARVVAPRLSERLGQPVVVQNQPGASGNIGAEAVAKSNPDGYTVLIHHNGMSTAPALYRKMAFNPLTDFEYISQVVDVPMTLLGRKDLPAKNLQELSTYVKANAKSINLANAGLGAVSHLCGMLFQQAMGVDLTTVPFSGTAPAMNALLGGQVDLLCDQTTQTVPLIKDGRVKVYGVTTLTRLSALPNVPTLDEQGLKGFKVKVWHGMYAPKGTPAPVLKKLNDALKAAVKDPDFIRKQESGGATVITDARNDPAGHKNFVMSEVAKWAPVIRAGGIYAD